MQNNHKERDHNAKGQQNDAKKKCRTAASFSWFRIGICGLTIHISMTCPCTVKAVRLCYLAGQKSVQFYFISGYLMEKNGYDGH